MLIALLALAGLLLAGWLTLRHRPRVRGGADRPDAASRHEQN